MAEERTARMSSVLGETGVVIGNVNGVGDLEIRGRVQGSITLNGRVLIAETGVVLGNVEATHIDVAGEVRGDLSAKDGVEVQAQGRVEGNIEAPRVGIEAGARVRGMLRTGGELPLPKSAGSGPSERTDPSDPDVGSVGARPPAVPRRDELAPPPNRPEPPQRNRGPVARPRNENGQLHESRETREPRPGADSRLDGRDRSRKLKPARSHENRRTEEQLKKPEATRSEPRKPEPNQGPRKPDLRTSEPRKPDPPKPPERKKGAPAPPTFIKGARGRAK